MKKFYILAGIVLLVLGIFVTVITKNENIQNICYVGYDIAMVILLFGLMMPSLNHEEIQKNTRLKYWLTAFEVITLLICLIITFLSAVLSLKSKVWSSAIITSVISLCIPLGLAVDYYKNRRNGKKVIIAYGVFSLLAYMLALYAANLNFHIV